MHRAATGTGAAARGSATSTASRRRSRRISTESYGISSPRLDDLPKPPTVDDSEHSSNLHLESTVEDNARLDAKGKTVGSVADLGVAQQHRTTRPRPLAAAAVPRKDAAAILQDEDEHPTGSFQSEVYDAPGGRQATFAVFEESEPTAATISDEKDVSITIQTDEGAEKPSGSVRADDRLQNSQQKSAPSTVVQPVSIIVFPTTVANCFLFRTVLQHVCNMYLYNSILACAIVTQVNCFCARSAAAVVVDSKQPAKLALPEFASTMRKNWENLTDLGNIQYDDAGAN